MRIESRGDNHLAILAYCFLNDKNTCALTQNRNKDEANACVCNNPASSIEYSIPKNAVTALNDPYL